MPKSCDNKFSARLRRAVFLYRKENMLMSKFKKITQKMSQK